MALDLVVSGATGRMGRILGTLIRDADDLRALGGIAPDPPPDPDAAALGYPEIVTIDSAQDLLRRADAIIDFSAPDMVAALLDYLETPADTGTPAALLTGTTGLDDATTRRLRRLARSRAVLAAPNFSIGVNLLLGLVERAARALPADLYDIEIVETHHGRKEDAPSGTALALAAAAAAGRDSDLRPLRRDGRSGRVGPRPVGEIGLHAVRGGDVVGEHIVHLLGQRERIGLSHTASSRDLFAHGALIAARWVAGREAGWYEMKDVLGL